MSRDELLSPIHQADLTTRRRSSRQSTQICTKASNVLAIQESPLRSSLSKETKSSKNSKKIPASGGQHYALSEHQENTKISGKGRVKVGRKRLNMTLELDENTQLGAPNLESTRLSVLAGTSDSRTGLVTSRNHKEKTLLSAHETVSYEFSGGQASKVSSIEASKSSGGIVSTPVNNKTFNPSGKATSKPSKGQTVNHTEKATCKPSKGHTSNSSEKSTSKPSKGHTSNSSEKATSKPSKGHTSNSSERATSKPSKGPTSAPSEEISITVPALTSPSRTVLSSPTKPKTPADLENDRLFDALLTSNQSGRKISESEPKKRLISETLMKTTKEDAKTREENRSAYLKSFSSSSKQIPAALLHSTVRYNTSSGKHSFPSPTHQIRSPSRSANLSSSPRLQQPSRVRTAEKDPVQNGKITANSAKLSPEKGSESDSYKVISPRSRVVAPWRNQDQDTQVLIDRESSNQDIYEFEGTILRS